MTYYFQTLKDLGTKVCLRMERNKYVYKNSAGGAFRPKKKVFLKMTLRQLGNHLWNISRYASICSYKIKFQENIGKSTSSFEKGDF